jgi:hypothetical protein
MADRRLQWIMFMLRSHPTVSFKPRAVHSSVAFMQLISLPEIEVAPGS